MSTDLDIFRYWDYRVFLKDYFREKRESNPRYSLSVFAQKGNLGSRSFVSLIMDGKRNLGLSTVYKFGRALELDEKELRFFLGLVSFNQSKSEKEKEELYVSLKEMRPLQKRVPLESKQEEFYSDWRIPVIYTLLSGEKMARSAEWIQERIIPRAKLPEIKSLLAKLEALGFITGHSTGWKAEALVLKSSDEVSCFALKKFHRSMIDNAKEAVSLPVIEREISSATIKVTKADFEKIKSLVKDFRKSVCKLYDTGSSDNAFVAQLNLQLFPLSENIQKEKK